MSNNIQKSFVWVHKSYVFWFDIEAKDPKGDKSSINLIESKDWIISRKKSILKTCLTKFANILL